MRIETKKPHRFLLHAYEHYPRHRYHTLNDATLDKFDFICVPLHLEEVNLLINDTN